MTREEYEAFIDALIAGEKTEFKEWERTPYFDGCLPIEVMAERGRETLRYGPMKPVGLTNPHRPTEKPHAVVQLRQDNRLGTLFNMVGPDEAGIRAQADVFAAIRPREALLPGGLHRNTFLIAGSTHAGWNAAVCFAADHRREGCVESAAIGPCRPIRR
jgi:methylenetetrahydrofolate--tRNA-(uracil-5-)-methyltransferase